MSTHKAVSLRRKLYATLLAAMLMTTSSFIGIILIYEQVDGQQKNSQALYNLADTVESGLVTPLIFDDKFRSLKLLKTIRSNNQLEAIALYRKDSTLLAGDTQQLDTHLPARAQTPRLWRQNNSLHLSKSIIQDNTRIGTLYIHRQLPDMTTILAQRFLWPILPLVTLLLISFLCLWIPLKRLIVTPLHNLNQQLHELALQEDNHRRITPDRDDEVGEISHTINDLLDQQERQQSELQGLLKSRQDSQQQEHQLVQTLYESTSSALLVLNFETNLVHSENHRFLELFSFSPSDLGINEALTKMGFDNLLEDLRNPNQRFTDRQVKCKAVGMTPRIFNLSLQNLHADNEKLLILDDVTAKVNSQQSLYQEKERARLTLVSIQDAVITTDTEGRVLYLNPKAEQLTSYSSSEAKGKPIDKILNLGALNSRQPIPHPAYTCLSQYREVPWDQQGLILKGGKDTLIVEGSTTPMYDDNDKLTGLVNSFHDVTALRRLSGEVSHHTSHDLLTGLLNRRQFEKKLHTLLEQINHRTNPGILLFINLDQFRVINENCGQVGGDQLLCNIAKIIQNTIEQQTNVNYSLARLERDDFSLLLDNFDQQQAIEVADNILQRIKAALFLWEGTSFPISASIGIVPLKEIGHRKVGIISLAEHACKTAKLRGRNRYHIYENDDKELNQIHDSALLVPEINLAIEEERLELYCQRIKTADNGAVGEHMEVLIRMHDRQGNLVRPDLFLPTAEHYHLMPSVDQWVVTRTLDWLANLPADYSNLTNCAINLSGQSLNDDQFINMLKALISESPVPTEKICFEITETVAINNFKQTQELVTSLRKMGCRFSLDDFGSGMSSFAYLKHLPVDHLKIDGMFVENIDHSDIDFAIVKSIHNVGKALGMKTIAEYVKNDAIEEKLLEIGVDYLQGYNIEKPHALNESAATELKLIAN